VSQLASAYSKSRISTHKQGWPEPYIYGVYTVFLAGKSPNIRSCTVHIYSFGQSYMFTVRDFVKEEQKRLQIRLTLFWSTESDKKSFVRLEVYQKFIVLHAEESFFAR
jgi:hypothetical protein